MSDFYDDDVLRAWSPDVTPERISDWTKSIRNNKEIFFCATKNSEIIGFAAITLHPTPADLNEVLGKELPADVTPSTSVRIGCLYAAVEKEGIGSFMYDRLESIVTSSGKIAIVLNASLNAVEFYAKKGFSAMNPENSYAFNAHTEMKCDGMIKRTT